MVQSHSSIPVSMLRQFLFCRRILFFVLVRNIWPPIKPWMKTGEVQHEKIEGLFSRRRFGGITNELPHRFDREVRLCDSDVGLHGICDIVMHFGDGAFPVEVKTGISSVMRKGNQIQLAAYAILLERKIGKCVDRGYFLDGMRNKLREVLITQELREGVEETRQAILRDCTAGSLPYSAASDAQCSQCEFLNFCADRF